MARTARDSRLDLRVSALEKELIDRAARLMGSDTTGFVRSTVLAAAKEAIQAHEVIELTTEGSRIFVEALINPPEPNESLSRLADEFDVPSGR